MYQYLVMLIRLRIMNHPQLLPVDRHVRVQLDSHIGSEAIIVFVTAISLVVRNDLR